MNIRSLGVPVHTVAIVAAAYDPGLNGNPRIYAVSCGQIATLHVIDVFSGLCIQSLELHGTTHSWGVLHMPDGTVYMSSTVGNLYRMLPGADAIENMGKPIESEVFHWRLTSDERGNIYGGTCMNGKIFGYDPVTETFRDYGQVVEGEQYGRSVAVSGNTLYAGIGTVQAHLVAIDTVTGTKTEIALPPGYEQESIVYDLTRVNGHLLVRLSPGNTLLVYDLEAETWVDRVSGCSGFDVSQAKPGSDDIYFIKDNRLHVYNLINRELRPTSWPCDQPARDFAWIQWHDQELYPGWSLISVQDDGHFWIYNPDTDRGSLQETNVPGQPNKVQSLIVDKKDQVYAGGFFFGGTAMYDPHQDRITEYGSVGQPEGMTEFGDYIYLGIYPYSILYRYDPARPWVKGVNPEKLLSLKDEGQDRPFAFVPAGRELAIGTVPYYGQLGGALSMYDPDSGHIDVYRHVVADQSIVSLAYEDGFIYGGSSILGGLGTVTPDLEGMLFIWDPSTRKKVWEGVPVPGNKGVFAVTFDTNGQLWGLTPSHLFQFDSVSRQFTRLVSMEAYVPEAKRTQWFGWHAGDLWCEPSGHVCGSLLGFLFRYDPQSDDLTILQEEVDHAIGDRAGRIYFTKNTELYVMEP